MIEETGSLRALTEKQKGKREISVTGEIKRGMEGGGLKKKRITMLPGISSIDLYRAISVAAANSEEVRQNRSQAKGVGLINSEGQKRRVRFQAL